MLAWRKCLRPFFQFAHFPSLHARGAVAFRRLLNRVEQVLVSKRLGEKFYCSGFHGPHRHRDITMSRNENDGNMNTSLSQFSLEIQAAEPRKAHVEPQATGYIRQFCLEKFLP